VSTSVLYITTSVVPTQKDQPLLGRTKLWSRIPTLPQNKNNCTDEGQQQMTALNFSPFIIRILLSGVHNKLYSTKMVYAHCCFVIDSYAAPRQ
jgi:hypothetical protein